MHGKKILRQVFDELDQKRIVRFFNGEEQVSAFVSQVSLHGVPENFSYDKLHEMLEGNGFVKELTTLSGDCFRLLDGVYLAVRASPDETLEAIDRRFRVTVNASLRLQSIRNVLPRMFTAEVLEVLVENLEPVSSEPE